MEKYDYKEAVAASVYDYIMENINLDEYAGNRVDLEAKLRDDCWEEDSVTGAGSSSYTCNPEEAYKNLEGNFDLLDEAKTQLGGDMSSPETADVLIRCYVLDEAISMALDDIERDFGVSIDEAKPSDFRMDIGYSLGQSEITSAQYEAIVDDLTDRYPDSSQTMVGEAQAFLFNDILPSDRDIIKDIIESHGASTYAFDEKYAATQQKPELLAKKQDNQVLEI